MFKVAGQLSLLIAPLWLAAAATPLAAADDVAASAEAYIKSAWPAEGPGAAVIVTQGGEVIFNGTQGMADIETKRPITRDSVFRLGSITKQFTAALVLQLVDEGKLSLDDPLSKFVPGYPAPGAHATVRQLLNHTSGIRSYTVLPGGSFEVDPYRAYTTGDIIALVRDEPADFQPGADWRYNNSGYVLLAAVIEMVTGQPWHVALAERITGPLGLASIRYGVDEPGIVARALPYSAGPEGVRRTPEISMSLPSAAGALVGSVRDLARWAQALHHGQVLSAASYAQMIAPTVLADGRTLPYGLGLSIDDVRGFRSIGHGGGILGGLTDSLYLPERDLFVAVFVNSDAPQTMPSLATRRLAAMAAGKPFPDFRPIALDPAAIEPFLGLYSAAGQEGRLYLRDGRLFMQRGEGPEQPILAAEGERFFHGPNSLTWYQARRDEEGAVFVEMHPNGSDQVVPLTRTGPIPPPPVVPRAVLDRYVGRYELNGTIATVRLTDDNQLLVQLTGQPQGPPMRTVSANEFAGDVAGVRLKFEGEGPKATQIRSRYAGSEVVGTRIADGG